MRKQRACRADAHRASAPESARISSHSAIPPVFSLRASNSVPMPIWAGTTALAKYPGLLEIQSNLLRAP